MLTHEKLVELYRDTQEEKVLSVYLHGDHHDPADRNVWRRRLEQEVAEARKRLEGNGEGAAFEKALSRLEERLGEFEAFIPGQGWVGFATPGEVIYAETLPVPVPDVVRWEKGIRVAPYVRGLKQERPVLLVLVDSRRARVFRYRDGDLTEVRDLRADMFMGDLSDIGTQKRPTHRSGIRGKTSTDAAQRFQEVGTERMLKELMEDVVPEEAGVYGYVVIGGTQEAVAQAMNRASKNLAPRIMEKSSLRVDMDDSEVRESVGEAASELSGRHQMQLLEDTIDLARSGGNACLGVQDVERALLERRVSALILSRGFITRDPDHADHCVGAGFEQGAQVEEVSGAAASELDRQAEGIAARLHYRVAARDDDDGGR